jgi:predicted metalloprotease with PDZ domain
VYTTENYALNVLRFTARDGSSERLLAPKSQPSAWRIDTSRTSQITVEFDYVARTLAWNQAKITNEYAFFTGTQLFLEPIGHRGAPATVRFIVPSGWRIASALRDTAEPSIFTAADYDELADAPTVLGSFDFARFEVDGKPHLVVTTPAGAYSADNVAAFVQMLPKIIRTDRTIFGSLPYDKYVFFYFSPTIDMAGGNIEHSNSSVYPAGSTLDEGDLVSVAHEFFHLWNVKRIRPAAMWPYDYSRVNPGPSLWVSEGITSYYERLTAYRAGVLTGVGAPAEGAGPDASRMGSRASVDAETSFLRGLAFRISEVETNPERQYISPSDASISGGLAYRATGFAYGMGEVLGALLDLSILHDTGARRGLDDVMRALYIQHYERGRGFTPNDLIRIVSATAGRDYSDFFSRYVTDVQVPPYDSIFAYAGYRVSRSSRKLGVLGVAAARSMAQGRYVYLMRDPASPAAQAGIRVGDVIVSVDGVPMHQVPLTNLFGQNWIGGRFLGKAGERVVLKILRDGKEQDIAVTLGTREETNFRIEADPAATTAQLAVRSAWLKR